MRLIIALRIIAVNILLLSLYTSAAAQEYRVSFSARINDTLISVGFNAVGLRLCNRCRISTDDVNKWREIVTREGRLRGGIDAIVFRKRADKTSPLFMKLRALLEKIPSVLIEFPIPEHRNSNHVERIELTGVYFAHLVTQTVNTYPGSSSVVYEELTCALDGIRMNEVELSLTEMLQLEFVQPFLLPEAQ